MSCGRQEQARGGARLRAAGGAPRNPELDNLIWSAALSLLAEAGREACGVDDVAGVGVVVVVVGVVVVGVVVVVVVDVVVDVDVEATIRRR